MKYILKNKGKGTHGGSNPVSVNDLYRLDTPKILNLIEIETRSYNDLQDLPTIPIIPTNVSAFTNDSGYITGITWDDVTGKPTLNIVDWDEAYSWGDHALAGYTKTDTTYSAGSGLNLVGTTFSVKYGTTSGTAAAGNDNRIINGNTAYGWGNHATQGYLKTYTDTNTTYTAGIGLDLTNTTFSVEFGTTTNTVAAGNDSRITNGATAYSWGNHANAGYITGVSWAEVTGKPTTFTPSAHTHDDRYYTEAEIDAKLAGVATGTHTHDDRYYTETEIDTKLGGKANTSHTHTVSQITDFPVIPNSTSDLTNDSGFITGVSWTEVTGKPIIPNSTSDLTNDSGFITGVTWAEVTGKPAIPDSTSDLTNDSGFITGVSWSQVTGKPTLDNYGSWNLKTNGIQRTTVGSNETLDLVAGTNITLSYGAGGQVTINSTAEGGASTDHNHDTDYAPLVHTHSYNDLTEKPNLFTAWGFKIDDEFSANYIGQNEIMTFQSGTNIDISRPGGANTYKFDVLLPTTVSSFTNDAGYITSAGVPTNVSEFTNDAGYITANEVPDAQVVEGTIDINASRTLTAADKGKTIILSGTTTLTIPTGLGTDFEVNLINDGSGVVTIAGATGTNLRAPHGKKLLPGYSANILKRTGAETFYIQGELTV